MDAVKLPTGKAHEPEEEACQPLCTSTMSSQEEANKPKKRHATFADDVSSTEKEPSQSSSAYKEALSQPAPGLSHRHRLAWLQRRRGPGLWAQCDACDSWRHLPTVAEPSLLPAKWYCSMNPDKSMADCSVPETPLRIMEEEDLIHSEYSAGSLVWARLPGWPWWPAMVDDCPDTEQFYWLDGFSDIPTHYNVVFFDSTETTRAWISPENLKPYTPNKTIFRNLSIHKKYKKRIEKAMQYADKAGNLPVLDRLEKYSFISTYKGAIVSPKKITKRELERFQKKLKRKFNVNFPTDETETGDEESVRAYKERNKKRNVILLGTPKSSKTKQSVKNGHKEMEQEVRRVSMQLDEQDDKIDDTPLNKEINRNNDDKGAKNLETQCATEEDFAIVTTATTTETNEQPSSNDISTDTFKQLNSMAIEIGSTQTQTLNMASEITGFDNDSSKTYVPELPQEKSDAGVHTTQDFQIRIENPSSDDFDF